MSKFSLIIKLLFTLLLVSGMVYLAKIGVADFLRLEPTAYVEDVQKGIERPGAARLLEARDRLLSARSWDMGNPLIPEYLGQIAIIRAQLISLSPMLQEKLFREAVEDFDAALLLRPNSAYLWADRMTAGSLLLEANEKTTADTKLVEQELPVISIAMRHATDLGPWEPKVLAQVVRVGRLRYESFSDETRALVVEAVVRADKLHLKI
jgi:hypothetical protein